MTIQDDINHNHRVRAWCNKCRHCAELDLQALGERLGFDHPSLADDLVPTLRCSKCGSKDLSLIVSSRMAGKAGDALGGSSS